MIHQFNVNISLAFLTFFYMMLLHFVYALSETSLGKDFHVTKFPRI